MRCITCLVLLFALCACQVDSNPSVAQPHVDEGSYVGAPGSTAP
jgi:hypothetical protein